MSITQLLGYAMLGVGFAVLLLLTIAEARAKQRAMRDLPPDTSGGTPALTTRHERRLALLFCVFVLSAISWLIAS